MVKLQQKSAAAGLVPITEGDMTLSEAPRQQIWSVAPYPGKDAGLPAPNSTSGKAGERMVWAGRDQALWIGNEAPDASLSEYAAADFC